LRGDQKRFRLKIRDMDKKTISEVMREMGRKGGRIGGKMSLQTMTAAERSARAKKAVAAREAKRSRTRKP
jgi:hypothetical protein